MFKSQSEPIYRGALIVLVNNGSASASEILSGAIRDNGRGKLLGEKTFGKGSVQKSFNLDDDIGVAITVAKYYTPSGELIHKKGIKPDYRCRRWKNSRRSDMKNLKTVRDRKLLEQFVTKGHGIYRWKQGRVPPAPGEKRRGSGREDGEFYSERLDLPVQEEAAL